MIEKQAFLDLLSQAGIEPMEEDYLKFSIFWRNS